MTLEEDVVMALQFLSEECSPCPAGGCSDCAFHLKCDVSIINTDEDKSIGMKNSCILLLIEQLIGVLKNPIKG